MHGCACLLRRFHRALEDRARLHLGNFGIGDGDAHAAETEHRIELVQFLRARFQLGRIRAHAGRHFRDFRIRVRQEFVQRRIEQANRHRQAVHDLEQGGEIAALHRQQLVERGATAFLVVGENHLTHGDDAVALEEHVFGAAKADALGAELPRRSGVGRRIGVGAHLHTTRLVRPFHQLAKVARKLGLQHRHRALDHLTGRAVHRDDVALLEDLRPDAHRAAIVVDADRARARDAGLAHTTRHDGGVRGHAAACGENAFGSVHPVDVFRAGLDAHQNDLVTGRFELLRFIRVEDDLARGRARRSRQAGRHDLALGLGVDGGMQQLIERGWLDAQHGFLLRDQAFVGHVYRDLQRRLGGALAIAGLQHPQLAALDREFQVLHVAIMRFQQVGDPRKFLEYVRQRRFHRRLLGLGGDAGCFRDVLWRTDARHHILALRVDQELAIELVGACRGVAREGDAGRGTVAHIAEHHGLNIDGRAPARGNVVQAAVGDGALVHPRREDRADRAPQLFARILRERLAAFALHDFLVFADHVAPVGGGQFRVEREAFAFLVEFQRILEIVMIEVEHHVRIHLDEAAVGIEGEALVAGAFRQRADSGVVEAEIEHRVHHAGHGGAGAGAHGHEQGIGLAAKFPAGELADMGERRVHLGRQFGGVGALVGIEIGADFCGDREAGRDGEAEIGHFREIRPFAAEQVLHPALALGLAVAEGVDPFRHVRSPSEYVGRPPNGCSAGIGAETRCSIEAKRACDQ